MVRYKNDLLLTFYSNYGPIYFQDIARYLPKILHDATSIRPYRPTFRTLPFDFCNGVWYRKTRMIWATIGRKKSDNIL